MRTQLSFLMALLLVGAAYSLPAWAEGDTAVVDEAAKKELEERLQKVAQEPQKETGKGKGKGKGEPGKFEPGADGPMMAKFDTDGDGKLSEDERAKMREAMEKKGAGQNPEMKKRLMERFDADHDGKLSDTERAKAMEAYQKIFAERQKKGKQGGGPKGEGRKSEESISKLTDDQRAKAQEEFNKIFEKQ